MTWFRNLLPTNAEKNEISQTLANKAIFLVAVGFFLGLLSSKLLLSPLSSKSLQNNFRPTKRFETDQQKTFPRLFCMVLMSPDAGSVDKVVEGVKATWGQRCGGLLFISSKRNDSLPAVSCNCTEGYDYLWAKVKAGFTYVHRQFNQRSKFDWFLKADDDTYVIVENLKAMLSRYDADKPFILGRRIAAHIADGYMAGGSGYVLSRSAVADFVEKGLSDRDEGLGCRRHVEKAVEDVEMGKCLHVLNAAFVDTRDPDDNLETFIPHDPVESLTVTHSDDFWLNIFNYYKGYKDGPKCCSSRPVSFHRVTPAMMKTLDYFIYRFQRRK